MQGKKSFSWFKFKKRPTSECQVIKKTQAGFVLPMIVVTGLVLMIIMAFTLQTLSVSRENLTNQRAQLLARQAAESGLERAQQCMREDKENIGWDGTKPIKPNTNCKGDVKPGLSQYVTENENYRASFEARPIDIQDDFRNMSSVGKLEVLKQTSLGKKVIKTYKYTLAAHIKTDLTFEDVVFGSLYTDNGFNDLYSQAGQRAGFSRSVYFFTKTHSGRIASVGYNMDGILTGYRTNALIPWEQRFNSDPKLQYEIPYHLVNPKKSNGSTVPIKKIITDFQGNGWVAFFLGYDGRTVYGTGSNLNCDLGTGTCSRNNIDARPIWEDGKSKMDVSAIPADEKIVDIKYNSSTYVLTDKGRIYFTGKRVFAPGMGNRLTGELSAKPQLITGNDIEKNVVKKLYTDSYYNRNDGVMAVAVTDQGDLYAWGQGTQAQSLGLNGTPKKLFSSGRSQPGCKRRGYYNHCYDGYGTITSGKIIDAVTDGGTIWALDDKGVVWAAGNNEYGQTGLNHERGWIGDFMPLYIQNKKITKIAADAYSVLFLTADGEVYGAGLNNKSQLGFPANTYKYGPVPCSREPRKYQLPDGKIAKDIFIVSPGLYRHNPDKNIAHEYEADNYRNSFVVTTDGEVYGAGSNRHGQLGVGKGCAGDAVYSPISSEYNTPQKMILDYKNNDSGMSSNDDKVVRAKYVRSGIGTTIVITDLNYVFTVGNNSNGQLGSGDTRECHIPKRHRYTNVFQAWYY